VPRSPLALASLLLLCSGLARAQGTVQLRDPRRPAPLDPPPECELWRGHIAGNDPSAEATLQLCTTGDEVSGVFLWSSLESGWDRRAFAGRWLDGRARLELRDTAMIENHPANGWRLCLAERYLLRRVSDAELDGEFWSPACNDHGTLRITRFAGEAQPALTAPAPQPAQSARRDARPQPRRASGCSAAPGAVGAPSGLAALLALAAISRSRCSRARR
jgi:hypothetical protein